MLRSLWLLLVYASFLGVSSAAPFVATLGYVWVDTFGPQNVAYILLNQIPVAMIMGPWRSEPTFCWTGARLRSYRSKWR